MSDIKVHFMHPTDGRLITVTVDDSMTAQEAISELIANDFIQPNPLGYNLAIKGSRQIKHNESFSKAGLKDNDTIRVIPATDAGGEETTPRYTGILGLDRKSDDKFTIDDIKNSPAAIIMIINMYDDLKVKYENQTKTLEYERLKSNNRFISTMLLFISQFILSIGANLLTSNKSIAIPVLIAGTLQASLAMYFTFKKPKN